MPHAIAWLTTPFFCATVHLQTTVIAPKPCPPEVLADIEAWKLHKKEELEELAKCREYGGEVDREIFNKVDLNYRWPARLGLGWGTPVAALHHVLGLWRSRCRASVRCGRFAVQPDCKRCDTLYCRSFDATR